MTVPQPLLLPALLLALAAPMATAAETTGREASIQILSASGPVKSPEYYDALAAQAAQAEDWSLACRVYDEGLETFPGHPRLRHNAAAIRDAWVRAAMARQQWETALTVCENALHLGLLPDHFRTQIAGVAQEAGLAHVRNADPLGLEFWLAHLLGRFPAHRDIPRLIPALYAEALASLPLSEERLYVRQGLDWLRSHQRLTGLDHPDADMVAAWCGRLLEEQWRKGEWAGALQLLQTARELLPDEPRLQQQEIATWDRQARAYTEQRQWHLAVMVYEQALARFPQQKGFAQNLNYCRWKQESLEAGDPPNTRTKL